MEDAKKTTFADRLKSLREENCFSRKEAAQLIGVSQSTYHHWECEGHFPRPDAIRKIASAYGISPRWLEVGLGEKTPEKETERQEELLAKKKYDSQVIYRAEDKTDLESVNLVMKMLPTMGISRKEKRQIHATLSKYRADLESKVMFGEGGLN